jgi:MFS transporter, DHA2 family, multidrug resistance protein
MVLIPTMLEGLGGYPVMMIGLLLAPRGIGNLIAMIVCGRLVTRIDPRLMLAAGFFAQGVSTWMMSGFTLETGVWQVFWASLLQGFAVGVMFIPLTIITFETLPQVYRTDGTSLFHLFRNIGSSIGISLAITYLTRSTQHNRAELSLHASPFNDMLALSGADGFWDLESVEGVMTLAREIDRQATMIAYVNDFWLMTLLAFGAIPLILLASRQGGNH